VKKKLECSRLSTYLEEERFNGSTTTLNQKWISSKASFFLTGIAKLSVLFDVLTVRKFALIIVPSILRTYGAPKKIAIPAPISPNNTIIRPAVRDAKITTASIRIPLIGELNKGTSDMPLNRV
jgi:hypothetical protein